jgi:SAM-dependent methyltransferase
VNLIIRAFAAPIRRFFNPRFEALASRLASLEVAVSRLTPLAPNVDAPVMAAPVHEPTAADPAIAQVARQAAYLARVDVSEHNRAGTPPDFSQLTSQAVSAAQCEDPTYLEWFRLLTGTTESELNPYNRKTWEWAYIAEAVAQAGLMKPGRAALGFGVGNEPLPALFASRGLDVVATDQGVESGDRWASTGELMSGLSGLSRPHLVADEELASHVEVRNVDMNDVPADLGTFDVIWSSCVIEHLGSPERGLDFVLESCRLLAPGGIAVHTTELELTARDTTADYGHCAVYRLVDLRGFAGRLSELNCTSTFNFTVPMDTREDRWISLISVDGQLAPPDIAHLKLAIGESLSTSFGLLIRRHP